MKLHVFFGNCSDHNLSFKLSANLRGKPRSHIYIERPHSSWVQSWAKQYLLGNLGNLLGESVSQSLKWEEPVPGKLGVFRIAMLSHGLTEKTTQHVDKENHKRKQRLWPWNGRNIFLCFWSPGKKFCLELPVFSSSASPLWLWATIVTA